jgi:hypothetical protein
MTDRPNPPFASNAFADLPLRAGLRIEAQLGGFDGRPFNHDSPEIITIAMGPTDPRGPLAQRRSVKLFGADGPSSVELSV